MPIQACGPFTGSLPTINSPEDASSKPPTIRSRVDLPQPDGPMMEKNSPALTSSETLFTATTCSDPLSRPPNACSHYAELEWSLSFCRQSTVPLAPTNRRNQKDGQG